MSKPFQVRPLVVGDLDALLALYQHLHRQDDPLPSHAELESTWQAIVGDPALIYLGGFVDGLMVTSAHAVIVKNLTRGARPFAVIENVVTHAGYRRRGYSRELLKRLLERCWERRCYKVSLTSASFRDAAHELYEGLGFDKEAKRAFVITKR
jgi:GNAT superfamily N-acetyltransferase